MTSPLRLMVYDRTCAPGLSTAWSAGSVLYRGLGRLDATFGASSWDEALTWLATHDPARPIAEVQYWGHGRWGCVLIDREPLDAQAFRSNHALFPRLAEVRERFTSDARVWLRTCEAFGAHAGQDFARRITDHLGVPVAGHTFVIGAWQSGLRGLKPGCAPTWSAAEGIAEGTPAKPLRAHGSWPNRPRTIHCLQGHVPDAWF